MMRAVVRLCAFAGLSLSAETIAENASAKEGCPPVVSWTCGDGSASNKGARTRTKPAIDRRQKATGPNAGAAAKQWTKTAVDPSRPCRLGQPSLDERLRKTGAIRAFPRVAKGPRAEYRELFVRPGAEKSKAAACLLRKRSTPALRLRAL